MLENIGDGKFVRKIKDICKSYPDIEWEKFLVAIKIGGDLYFLARSK